MKTGEDGVEYDQVSLRTLAERLLRGDNLEEWFHELVVPSLGVQAKYPCILIEILRYVKYEVGFQIRSSLPSNNFVMRN